MSYVNGVCMREAHFSSSSWLRECGLEVGKFIRSRRRTWSASFQLKAGCVAASTCCMMLQPRRRHASYCFHGSALADMSRSFSPPFLHRQALCLRRQQEMHIHTCEEAVTEGCSLTATTRSQRVSASPLTGRRTHLLTWPMLRENV